MRWISLNPLVHVTIYKLTNDNTFTANPYLDIINVATAMSGLYTLNEMASFDELSRYI